MSSRPREKIIPAYAWLIWLATLLEFPIYSTIYFARLTRVALSVIGVVAVLLLITGPIMANHQTFGYKYYYHGKYYYHNIINTVSIATDTDTVL